MLETMCSEKKGPQGSPNVDLARKLGVKDYTKIGLEVIRKGMSFTSASQNIVFGLLAGKLQIQNKKWIHRQRALLNTIERSSHTPTPTVTEGSRLRFHRSPSDGASDCIR